MTLDGFLTFLTLAAAIYAVMGPVVKLQAKLNMARQIPSAILAFLFVIYFEFFELVGQPCPLRLKHLCGVFVFPTDKSFTPPQAAFFVVLIWMMLAWSIQKLSRPKAASLPTMTRIVDELVYEKQFAEVLKFVHPHLNFIKQAACRELPLQRLHDRIAKLKRTEMSPLIGFLNDNMEDQKDTSRFRRFFRVPIEWLGNAAILVPAQRKAEAAAVEIARVLFRSADLRRYIASMRPYFATALLRLDLYGKHDFSDAFFETLFCDTGSVLYQELVQNQNITNRGYAFPESNSLLHFLFADVRTAEKLAVWKPVGEHLLKILRPGEAPEYVAHLNGRADDFENARWNDPTFAGIFFFDLMVTAAAHQGVRWHMWLYYFPSIVAEIVDLYDESTPAVDPSDEFPTRSARLLYEAIGALGDWVTLIDDLPENSPHRKIQPGYHGDNSNIPVSAAMALGGCMVSIAMSDKLNEKFVVYMHECVMRDIRGLRRDGIQGTMRTYLIQCLVRGGQRRPGVDYKHRLVTLFGMADHVLRAELDDYQAALEAVE